MQRIVITGAAGNLGSKLRHQWADQYELRLIDKNAHGDNQIIEADISTLNSKWTHSFEGADILVHLAAESFGCADFNKLVRNNIDGTLNVLAEAVRRGVKRIIFTSTSHVMGRYKYLQNPYLITPDLEPRPGGTFVEGGWRYDSTNYAITKIFGERMCRQLSEQNDVECIVLRLGMVMAAANTPTDIPKNTEQWLRQLWLSNRDLYALLDRCLDAQLKSKFVIANAVSKNEGSRWDLQSTFDSLGFQPQDGIQSSLCLSLQNFTTKLERACAILSGKFC